MSSVSGFHFGTGGSITRRRRLNLEQRSAIAVRRAAETLEAANAPAASVVLRNERRFMER
jgi:hypothetical protein